MSNKLFYIFIICLYFTISNIESTKGTIVKKIEHFTSKQTKLRNASTKLDDIIYFKDLKGGQYTLGFGYNKKTKLIEALAVYDKTFSGPLTPSFWHTLLLGSLGINDLNLSKLQHSINKKKKKKKNF